MVKEPHPGRVKTRLGRDIGYVNAAWWFRHRTQALFRRLRDPRWTILLAVSPDREGLNSRVWPPDLRRVSQGNGNLGDRMHRLLCVSARGPVCIIGADIPAVNRRRIAHAFAEIGKHEFVFGPARDGGFWLIGARRTAAIPPKLFKDVRWSTRHALSDTLSTLPGYRIAFIDSLQDVDTAADLAKAHR